MNMQTTFRLQRFTLSDLRTYLTAALFVAGNVALPQLFHLVPQGGVMWLPIYFFTLAGAYAFGWRVGLLTALASPVINSALFGMPGVAVLPAIMLKSVRLAVRAGKAAERGGKVTVFVLAAIVAAYQVIGTLGEWALTGDLTLACQDLRLGVPGMLLQIFGGWLLISRLRR